MRTGHAKIQSLSDLVESIDAMKLQAAAGEDVFSDVEHALAMIDIADIRTIDDAAALTGLIGRLLGAAVEERALRNTDVGAGVCQAFLYIRRIETALRGMDGSIALPAPATFN